MYFGEFWRVFDYRVVEFIVVFLCSLGDFFYFLILIFVGMFSFFIRVVVLVLVYVGGKERSRGFRFVVRILFKGVGGREESSVVVNY